MFRRFFTFLGTPQACSALIPESVISEQHEIVQMPDDVAEQPWPREWHFPPLDLLRAPSDTPSDEGALVRCAMLLERAFKEFNVECEVVRIRPGPVFTTYIIEVSVGTRIGYLVRLSDDIARLMCAISLDIAPIPGSSSIAIQIRNPERQLVYARNLIGSAAFQSAAPLLTFVAGADAGGMPFLIDLASLPHLLVGGTTGSGKSTFLDAMLISLLCRLTPHECRFVLIDLKLTDFLPYAGLPHLLTPVLSNSGDALAALTWLVKEMEARYQLLAKVGARNLQSYNMKIAATVTSGEPIKSSLKVDFDNVSEEMPNEDNNLLPIPYIVVLIKEIADLKITAGDALDDVVGKLTRMGRSVGIHLVLATQRATVDVLSGGINSNLQARISFQVVSETDSRANLGQGGAERLLGAGDMLFRTPECALMRIQGACVNDQEVEAIINHWRMQADAHYINIFETESRSRRDFDDTSLDLYEQAVDLVIREGKASTSFVQRHLQIGYNRAARLLEQMEVEGIISRPDQLGRREIFANAKRFW